MVGWKSNQMVRLLQIIKIIAHTSELLNARYISGQIVGLISRRSWVRVPLSQFCVNRRRFSLASENKYEELRRVDSRLHSLGLSLRLLARLRRVKIAYFKVGSVNGSTSVSKTERMGSSPIRLVMSIFNCRLGGHLQSSLV